MQKANVENAKVEFQKRLVLKDISFKHQGATNQLSNLSMEILPKTSIVSLKVLEVEKQL